MTFAYAGGGPVKTIVKGGLSQLGRMLERATSPLGAAKGADPLAYAVAARQAAQLERAGELLGSRPGALTQLYADPAARAKAKAASDAALLEDAKRRAETLENPGRRRFVKDAAAMAARAAIPGGGQGAALARELFRLGSEPGLNAAQSVEQMVQEAIAKELRAALSDRGLVRVLRGLSGTVELDSVAAAARGDAGRLRDVAEELGPRAAKHLPKLLSWAKRLEPEAVDAAHGLPEGATRAHLSRAWYGSGEPAQGAHLFEAAEDALTDNEALGFFDADVDSWLDDWGLGQAPRAPSSELAEAVGEFRARYPEDPWPGTPEADEADSAYVDLVDHALMDWEDSVDRRETDQWTRLVGRDAFNGLCEDGLCGVQDRLSERWDSLLNAYGRPDGLEAWLSKLLEKGGGR